MKSLLYITIMIMTSCIAPKEVTVREEIMTLKRIEKVIRYGYERQAYVWADGNGIEYFDDMPIHQHEVGDTVIRLVTR